MHLNPKKKSHEDVRTEFLEEHNRVLGELREYYGDDIEDFTTDCERAREGEIGITSSIKLLAWAKEQLAAFRELDDESDAVDRSS